MEVVYGSHTIAVAAQLGGALDVSTLDSAAAITFSGDLSGKGSLTLEGSGTLNLTGSNSYSGSTTIRGGTLGSAAAGGLSTSSACFVNGGVLDVRGGPQTVCSLNVAASGALNLYVGMRLTSTGSANLGGTLNVYGSVASGGTVDLINYPYHVGSFSPGALPANCTLDYLANQLDIVNTNASPGPSQWTPTGQRKRRLDRQSLVVQRRAERPAGVSRNRCRQRCPRDRDPRSSDYCGHAATRQLREFERDDKRHRRLRPDLGQRRQHHHVAGQREPRHGDDYRAAHAQRQSQHLALGRAMLTIMGDIGQTAPSSLTLTAAGELILAGSNGYTGGTAVEEGTLDVVAPNALPSGSNLSVGSGAASLFGRRWRVLRLCFRPTRQIPCPNRVALRCWRVLPPVPRAAGCGGG